MEAHGLDLLESQDAAAGVQAAAHASACAGQQPAQFLSAGAWRSWRTRRQLLEDLHRGRPQHEAGRWPCNQSASPSPLLDPRACATGPASRESCFQTCRWAGPLKGELQGLPLATPASNSTRPPLGRHSRPSSHLEDGRLPLIELVPPLQQPLGVVQLPVLLLKGGPGQVGEAPAGQGLQALAEQVAAQLAVPLALLHDGPVAPQGPALCTLDKSHHCIRALPCAGRTAHSCRPTWRATAQTQPGDLQVAVQDGAG